MAQTVPRRALLLERLREICLRLPECKEKVAWGNPTFVAGKKQFAVLDHYHGRWCIAFVARPDVQRKLIRRNGFFAAPYGARYGWVCRDAEGPVGWKELEKLIVESYRNVALKRMLAALDGESGNESGR